MAYTQKNNPFPVTSCGRRRTYMQDSGVKKIGDKPPLGNKSPLKLKGTEEKNKDGSVGEYVESKKHIEAQNEWLEGKRSWEMLVESVGLTAAKVIKNKRKELINDPNLTTTIEGEKDGLAGGYTKSKGNPGEIKIYKGDYGDEYDTQTVDHEASHATDVEGGGGYSLKDITGKKGKRFLDVAASSMGMYPLVKLGDQLVNKHVRGKLHDEGERYVIPKKDVELINNSLKPTKHINDFYRDLKKKYPSSSEEQLNKYVNKDYKSYIENQAYIAKPTEVRARLSEMRNILDRKYNVDIFNEKVTKKDLNKVINSDAYKNMNKFFDEDKILNMMNKISYNENNQINKNKTNYA